MGMTPQEASAAGLGWVDENNPNYGKPGFVGPQTAAGANPNRESLPNSAPLVDNGGVATHKQTVSADGGPLAAQPDPRYKPTPDLKLPDLSPLVNPDGSAAPYDPKTFGQTPPGAAPAAQSMEDTVRDAWLKRANQSTTVDPNDPNIKQQVDPFAAQQERARRQYESEAAERLSAGGMGDSGAMDAERRLGMERAGQATGMFQSTLIREELQNKRSEIQDALNHLEGRISEDKKLELEMILADLDAAIKREGFASDERIADKDSSVKREGIASNERLGNQDAAVKREGIASGEKVGMSEIGVKKDLGTAANSNELIRALLTNQQFGDGQALDWSQFDWDTSPYNPKNR